MADRYCTPGGWTVEVIRLDAGDRLRIRHHGFYVADVVNVDDLPAGYRRPSWRSWSATR